MNRNLKRVLSVALMAVMLAVNFVIPAMAATTVTVSYTDLLTYGSLTGRQGELYYETNASSVESASTKNGAYNPLEVWSNVNNAGLNIKASEWVRFEVTAETAGYYSVGMNAAVGATNGTDVYIRTESSITEKDLARTGTQYQYTDITDLGYVYLEEGSNYIYVDNKGGSYINFRSLTLTLDETADATDVAWLAPIASANEIAGLTVVYNDGYNQADVSEATLTFPVDIPLDGKYQVSVMGKAGGSNTVATDFGGDAKEATVSNSAYGYTALGVFPLTADEYTLTLDGFTNYSLAWVKVEYVGTYNTEIVSETISDGATVSRGTDSYVIELNDNIVSVDAATQITLASAEDTIETVATVEGKELTVSFKETLDYETPYTLTVTGLKGVYDEEAMADHVVTFTTADETNTDGTATVEVTDVTTSRENGTVTGIVKGSTGVGIKGRAVTVYDSYMGEVATGVSGDGGVFEIDFTITETVAGVHTYTVDSEYGATASAIVSYVSEAEELGILSLFASATTPEAVYSIFENYGEVLMVPTYAEDCDALANDALFLAHFMGKTFTAVSEVAPFYKKMLTLEGMNQATVGSRVDDYLTAEICELIGIASDKLDLVIINDPSNSNKISFAADIARDTNTNGASTSEEDFKGRIARLLDAWLLVKYQIEPTTLVLPTETISCRYASEIAIPIKFATAQTKVKTIVVTVTTAQAALLENAKAVVAGLAPVNAVISGNTATFTLDFEENAEKEYTEVGKISLQASIIDTHSIDVAATVSYRLTSDDNYADMDRPVTGDTVSATVTSSITETPRPVTGGGGYTAPPKEPEKEEEDTQKSKYFFDDMADALWAQDMVHALVGKGVISKNDERAFRPMDNVTREEFVKMLVTVVGTHNANATSSLTDVGANHWATSYIATAQELGIVQGNADGTFGLGQKITRQDMAVMVYRTFALLGIDLSAGSTAFADGGDIADYAKNAVSALEKQGIINGMGDGTFAPVSNATRAQSAKIIYAMMEVLGV